MIEVVSGRLVKGFFSQRGRGFATQFEKKREGEAGHCQLLMEGRSWACDIGGAQSDDHARAWRCPQIEPRQYHILRSHYYF
jgi:hypothetical protein